LLARGTLELPPVPPTDASEPPVALELVPAALELIPAALEPAPLIGALKEDFEPH